jgi:hypothetical protein
MQVEIKEINKIALAEDEVLFIKLPSKISMKNREIVTRIFLDNLPKEWKGRVFIMDDNVELTKVTKESIDGKGC